MKKTPGVVRLEKNTLPIVVLGVHCDFLFCRSSFMSAAPIFGKMGSLSLHKLAVTATGNILLLCTPFVQVAPLHHKQWGRCLQFAQM
jgi:hypothetical protein